MIVAMWVWGPIRCCVCHKKHKEGRCYMDKETGMRTDFYCCSCFDRENKADEEPGKEA